MKFTMLARVVNHCPSIIFLIVLINKA